MITSENQIDFSLNSQNMDIEEMPVIKYTVQLYFRPIIKDSFEINIPPPVQIASRVLIQGSRSFF
jgi:hypothetical protein